MWRERELTRRQAQTAPEHHTLVSQVRKKLDSPVTVEKGFDPQTPLGDALAWLGDRIDVQIIVDVQAFTAEGSRGNIKGFPVGLQPLDGVPLSEVLRLLLRQVSPPGGYVARPGYIEITTVKRAQAELGKDGEMTMP
jgi:hypothetical protein